MNLTLELTPDQVAQLAREVAAVLRDGAVPRLPVEDPPEALTVEQAAAALQIHPRTVARRVQAGVIRRVPGLGTAVRIPRAEIERMTKGGAVGG